MDTILPGPACLHQLVASEVRFERHEGGRDAALGSSAPAARGASPVDGFDRPSRASVSHGRRASVRDATFVVSGSGDRFAARQQVVVAMLRDAGIRAPEVVTLPREHTDCRHLSPCRRQWEHCAMHPSKSSTLRYRMSSHGLVNYVTHVAVAHQVLRRSLLKRTLALALTLTLALALTLTLAPALTLTLAIALTLSPSRCCGATSPSPSLWRTTPHSPCPPAARCAPAACCMCSTALRMRVQASQPCTWAAARRCTRRPRGPKWREWRQGCGATAARASVPSARRR